MLVITVNDAKKITTKIRNVRHLLLLCCLYSTVCLVLLYGIFLKVFGLRIVVCRGNCVGCNIYSSVAVDVNISGDLILFSSCIFLYTFTTKCAAEL